MKPPFYSPRPLDLPAEVPLEPGAPLGELDEAKIFAAPDDPEQWPAWRTQLQRWRQEAREKVRYSDARYRTLEHPNFVLAMANLWDGALYDHRCGSFTPEAYLERAQREFGGFDGVILWSAYPVVGIDDRRQLDFYLQIPDLPEVIARLKEGGVSVHLSYYPWVTGAAAQTPEEVASCVRRLGVDGLFLDSVKEGNRELRELLDSVSPNLLMGGESRVPLGRIDDHQMSWAQWFADSEVPGVLRAKWLERRHLLHHTRRWNRSHREELHSAWLNGSGILVWENVFGVWVGWNEADRAMLRSVRPVQLEMAEWLLSEEWTPLADHPGSLAKVYASRWEHRGCILWTIVNKGEPVEGDWLHVPDGDCGDCGDWAELTCSRELTVRRLADGGVAVGGKLEEGAVAAVLASPGKIVLPRQPASPLPTRSPEAESFPLRIAVRRPAPRAPSMAVPEGMIRAVGGSFELEVSFRLRETGLYGETPFVDEWKPPLGSRLHYLARAVRPVEIGEFAISELEVSNGEFLRFVEETGYRPQRAERFLDHWVDGRPRDNNAPAANVDLVDARAYARWRGWRLPTEDEWQLAAERGVIGRREPLVWNLTESEHDDGRTRFVILKGGSGFRNDASEWYFDGGPKPPGFSAKLLILAAGLSRSPNVGFRCAVDLGR
ncbi:MAG: SUMF1/EgtB/PvdO family nonheme iron enzyme [Trueperaceae bacterium]